MKEYIITIRQVGTTARPLFVTEKGSLTTDIDKAEKFTEVYRQRGLEKEKKLQKTYPQFRVWLEDIEQLTKNTPDAANTGRGNYQHSHKESK